MLDIIHRVHKLRNLWVDLQAETRLNGILPSVYRELAGDLIWIILTHLTLLSLLIMITFEIIRLRVEPGQQPEGRVFKFFSSPLPFVPSPFRNERRRWQIINCEIWKKQSEDISNRERRGKETLCR